MRRGGGLEEGGKGASSSMLRFEPPGLHPIATNFHVAPAAGMVFARVEEKPSTFQISAGADFGGIVGGKQGFGTQRQEQQWKFGCRIIMRQLPHHAGWGPQKMLMFMGQPER